jgi:hypothetical protein
VNIEAAHIIAEVEGGTNDEDNGIPVCFDCHQEMSAYNPEHPRGNQFTPEELKARRDKIYKLVESGALQAQIIAEKFRHKTGFKFKGYPPEIHLAEIFEPTGEVKSLLASVVSGEISPNALVSKINHLSPVKTKPLYWIDSQIFVLAMISHHLLLWRLLKLCCRINSFPSVKLK